jgi:hypothetical protein
MLTSAAGYWRNPGDRERGWGVALEGMNAKEKLLKRAPRWSEERAARALLAAEGVQSIDPEHPARGRGDLLARAALRGRQTRSVDVAALVREARGELDQRAS